MDAALGPQPAVGPPAVDRHGGALEAGLLALLLVDDLGPVAVPLRPAEVHPEEHLRPVGRLRAAGAGADRQERAALVVLAGEQQGGPFAPEVASRGPWPLARARRSAPASPDLGDELEPAPRGPPPALRGPATGRSRCAGRRPRAGPSGRRAGRPRSPGAWVSASSSATRASLRPGGQRRPEVDRIRSTRSRTAEAST